MNYVVLFLKHMVFVFANVMQTALLARAILSWFDMEMEWKISAFIYAITEPVIYPIRAFCQRMGWFQGMMLDIPFLIAMILLALVEFSVGVTL